MTDRRPDVNCTACGNYCHSLSHRPEEQKFPKQAWCGKCMLTERESQVMNHLWRRKGQQLLSDMIRRNPQLKPLEAPVGTFLFQGSHIETASRPKTGAGAIVTVEEWFSMSDEKLAHLRQRLGPENIAAVEQFIKHCDDQLIY